MSAKGLLRSNEKRAISDKGEFVSAVVGKQQKDTSGKGKKSFGAALFVTAMLAGGLAFFGSGNLIPTALLERLVEETDVQYADGVESKIIVFQQSLMDGRIPENTAQKLKKNGVLVGYVEGDEFIETNEADRSLSLKMQDTVISAEDFAQEANENVALYNAFTNATYGRAAYYYDTAAEKVFRKLGTDRDNYSKDVSFEDTVSGMLGEGSDIDVNSVVLKQEKVVENGVTKIRTYYDAVGSNAETGNESAENFVSAVGSKNMAATSEAATLNAANTLNIADTTSREQKSSLLFVAFMENISKMKAGEGNSAKVNEMMNYLYDEETTQVVDVETGELVEVSGSMMESPSLYAILSGTQVKGEKAKNFASDRVLKTVENQTGEKAGGAVFDGAVTSTTSKVRGSIGRFLGDASASASNENLVSVAPTINSSLFNNSFSQMKGIDGGEMLAAGAVNVGKELAKASGATAGSAEAIKSYAKLNASVLALDSARDRMNRSPLDITSKNTFLGSIVYNLAMHLNNTRTLLGGVSAFVKTAGSAISALMPVTLADDENVGFLTNFGECETLGNIGAVGTVGCSTVAAFDTSTLEDPFHDEGFLNFINNNTTLENGTRKIKQNSSLANFIKYNNERTTQLGVMDGGILKAISNDGDNISFISNITSMVETFLGASENNKRMASGAAFVNSADNADWQTYKYAQRYVSLARATEALKQYDGGATAYREMRFFEGEQNPVTAFLDEYYNIASN